MAKAIETGLPKMRIEEAAARRQAKIDSGADIIVGVNKYPPETEIPIEILEVDNSAVRATQIARLEKLRKERNNEDVEKALEAITKCAETKNGNLLELAIDAARKRASLGEISYAMEKVWGRHQEAIRLINNVYSSEYAKMDDIEQVRALTDKFAELEGRRPRILVAKMGQDGHDRGAKVVATAYADMGFDVDVGPLFQTPEETARQAVENDVHIIGISSLAGGHKTLLPKLMEELKKYGREDIIVTVGGVIPPQDYEFLYQNGAAAIFGPGTKLPESAKLVMEKLLAHKNE
jgi:methylmalonyl-CoA mutase